MRIPTPLARKLVRRIEADGPMSLADYMAACLGDPEHGYYMRRDPLGASGDFITAPEVSQIFGELIGLWCVAVWEAMGEPSQFVLAELGPGRGTLMADALRAARIRPEFIAAAKIVLVEISPPLREAQRTKLGGLGLAPAHVDRAEDIPAGPLIVVANEFFDALPIRQLVRTSEGWAERVVGLDDKKHLAFGLRPVDTATIAPTPSSAGTVVELRPAAGAITETLARRIAADGGAALVIDYGYLEEDAAGDTLQAIRTHRYDDPLTAPGDADITAHVDFAALSRAAARGGAAIAMPLTQAEFLTRLGIGERLRRLAAGKPPEAQAEISGAAHRLVHPEAMGTLFKMLAFGAPGLALPAFEMQQ